MSNLLGFLIGFVVVLAIFGATRLVSAWLRYRGQMVITCPENQRPAGVSLDTRHAAATGLGGRPALRLADCSRWPERAGCGQDCLRQIETAPEDCRVRTILTKWYFGKSCAWCGRAFREIHAGERKPAVLTPDRLSVEWTDIPAEQLEETLASALPLCFACHTANTMVRTRPDLVIDRHRPAVVQSGKESHVS
jgi:hypothetical protein